MACFPLRSWQSWHHRELTFDIIKTMVDTRNCASWNAQFMSYITLTLTRRSCKIMPSTFLALFLWKCFHWPTWTWIVFNRFPTPLNLLRLKLYLVVTSPYTIFILSWIYFDFFPSFVEEFYQGKKLQIPYVQCRSVRHCICHPPTASTYVILVCECGCYMSRYVPTCKCKVTPGVACKILG